MDVVLYFSVAGVSKWPSLFIAAHAIMSYTLFLEEDGIVENPKVRVVVFPRHTTSLVGASKLHPNHRPFLHRGRQKLPPPSTPHRIFLFSPAAVMPHGGKFGEASEVTRYLTAA